MREILFVKNNKNKWEAYENTFNDEKNISPVELTNMLIDVSEDLGYAQTHYPGTETEGYLNGLAMRIHQAIYKNKRYGESTFLKFFKEYIPDVLYEHRRYLFYSFAAFSFFCILGFVSQMYNPDYVRLILGDFYVDSTIERIKKGDPFGVYKEENALMMFIGIAVNNIKVSFLVFAAGILTSFGTYYLLAFNGIMLGSFFAFFHQYNLLAQASRVVWLHGTIEILSIIIAGAAGIIMGNSFLFSGNFPRLYYFQMKSKTAISIIYALIPFFLIAAFIESFVTRYTSMPVLLSILIIFASLTLMTGYFIFYPYYRKNAKL